MRSVQGRSPWLAPRAVEKIDKESYHKASRRETEKEKEREEGKIRLQAHDYTALLVNTMLRKHHGAVQRGHDVSILSSREPLLGGSTWNTLLSSSSSRRYHLFPIPPFFLLSLIPLVTALCSPDRAALFAKACRTFAKGVPHTGPHRSPRYLSRQISWLRCTPCNAVATTARSFAVRGTTFLFLRPLFLYSVVSSSLPTRSGATTLSLVFWLLALPVYPFVFFHSLSRHTNSFVLSLFLGIARWLFLCHFIRCSMRATFHRDFL